MSQYKFDEEQFREKIDRLYKHWHDHERDLWNGANLFHVMVGKIDDESLMDLKSTALHSWLLGYEFPDTMMLFSRQSMHIVTNKKKADIVTSLRDTYNEKRGPNLPPLELVVIGRMRKGDEEAVQRNADIMQKLIEKFSATRTVLGTFVNEQQSALQGSALVRLWDRVLKKHFTEQNTPVDLDTAMSSILAQKSATELGYLENAGLYSCHIMRMYVTQELETIIDENKQVTHKKFADDTELVISDPTQQDVSSRLKKLRNAEMDVSFSPIIQSGGQYTMDPDADPNTANTDDELHFGTITIEFGAKFKSYNTRLGRTYMVNSTKQQETYYKFLCDLRDHVIDRLRVGARLSDVYNSCVAKIDSTHPELLDRFSKNVGCGIGLEQHEKYLDINACNNVVVERGMVFVVRVSFADVPESDNRGDNKRRSYSLLLCDTVAIPLNDSESNKAIAYTSASDYQYGDVSYALEGSEDGGSDDDDDVEFAGATHAARHTRRTRQRVNAGTFDDPDRVTEEKRRELQEQIQEKKRMEWISNREEGSSSDNKKKKRKEVKKFSMEQRLANGELISYGSVHEFPINPSSFSGHSRKRIVVDETKETVLLPVGNSYVPFHIATIKNMSKSDEGAYMTLRINFKSVGVLFGQEYAPAKQFPNSVFIKEITYRAKDSRNLLQAMRVINELLKRIRQREKDINEKRSLVTQDKLILSQRGPSSFIPRLKDVNMRPTPKGRKTSGTLEAHENGFRYMSVAGDTIDIIYDNINYAFLQEARNDTMVLIHFHLHNSIMVGKRKVKDIQFFTEVLEEYDHLTGRWRNSMTDRESIEEEERERRLKKKLNEEFSRFCNRVCEKVPDLSFDEPYREQEFIGTPNKTSVALAPTNNCLVNLTEYPPFVLPMDDVELARFERVSHGIRNFDLVFVPKDYSKSAQIINSIPIEKIDSIKDWLNRCEIVYYEGPVPLNWKKTIETLKADPNWEPWDPTEGWSSILDLDRSDDEGDEDMDGEVEDEYVPSDDDEDDEYGGDSDDDDDFSRYVDLHGEDEDEEEYMDDDEDDEEEEGKTWEELEREASRADKNRMQKSGKWSDDEDDIERRRGGGGPPRKKRRQTTMSRR